MMKILSPKFHQLAFALMALWLALLTLGFALDRLALISPFDTGVYLDVLTSLSNGNGFAAPMLGESQFLAHHFQPLIASLLPLYWLSPSPWMLFACSSICAAFTLMVIWCRADLDQPNIFSTALICLFLTHPTVLCRMFVSFTPELLSLPVYTWLAFQLRSSKQSSLWKYSAMFLIAGLGKENFWLINGWLCILFWWKQRNSIWLAGAILQVGIFALLFLWWMPVHSNLEGYYGLAFIGAPLGSGWNELLQAMFHNVFSLRSVLTMGIAILLSGGICIAGANLPLWGAAPGLAMILVTSSSQVHHPGNHYLIPVLPFLFVAGMVNLDRWRDHFGKYASVIALLIASIGVVYTATLPGGVLDKISQVHQVRQSQPERRSSVQKFIAHYVESDAMLVTDGLYQPIASPQHQPTTVLLSFIGNPHRLDLSKLVAPFYVYTDASILDLPNCSDVRIGARNLDADYEYFAKLCEYIKSYGRELFTAPNGAKGYLITPPTQFNF